MDIVVNGTIVRKTRSICPKCNKELQANIVCKNGKIILEKNCSEHGDCSIILSSDPKYFTELSQAYFFLMPQNLPYRLMGLTLTPKCGLKCPICGATSSLGKIIEEMSLDDIDKIIRDNKKKEFMLWALEPTEHSYLEDILRLLKKNKKEGYMLTNGLKLYDYNLLQNLHEAGLSHVYLQFDGFDDNVYKILRGRNLLKEKLRVLDNLKNLNIPTSLEVILAKNVNEKQINAIIQYAVNNVFIRQIGFLPLIKIGVPDKYWQDGIVPRYYEFLEILERETAGRINLENLRAFQKLMYVVYRITKFRRCFWFTFYILIRDKQLKNYKTIDEFINLKKVEKIIDSFVANHKHKLNIISDLELIVKLSSVLLNSKSIILFFQYLKFILAGKKLMYSRSAQNFLFITYNEFCDPYKMDIEMSSKYCQDIVAMKNKENKIIFKPCYRVVIEDYKKIENY